MSRIVLKIDVDTYHGTQIGVPNLARILDQYQAHATFLFSLGPDHTGWAIRRCLRPGFLNKVARTSVLKHYGLKTLLYGTLLPAPDIGKKCVDELKAIANAGFETGLHCWDHVYWQDNVRQRNRAWTQKQMQLAYARFVEIFDTPPSTHGAAGWQMNADALRQIDQWGMRYASDGRGVSPYRLVLEQQPLSHIQMPTTLPTLDELIGTADITQANVADHLLQRTASTEQDEVFTLHAELEGQQLLEVFKKLLIGWHAQGHQLISMAEFYTHLVQTNQLHELPTSPLDWGAVPGRDGAMLAQKIL